MWLIKQLSALGCWLRLSSVLRVEMRWHFMPLWLPLCRYVRMCACAQGCVCPTDMLFPQVVDHSFVIHAATLCNIDWLIDKGADWTREMTVSYLVHTPTSKQLINGKLWEQPKCIRRIKKWQTCRQTDEYAGRRECRERMRLCRWA